MGEAGSRTISRDSYDAVLFDLDGVVNPGNKYAFTMEGRCVAVNMEQLVWLLLQIIADGKRPVIIIISSLHKL